MSTHYSGTMAVGGDVYDESIKGYQIGGAKYNVAWASLKFPSTGEKYSGVWIYATMYSVTAPSNWKTLWEDTLEWYINGTLYSKKTVTSDWFDDGDGADSREFSCGIVYDFQPGDEVMIKLGGSMRGSSVDSSRRCVYLMGAELTCTVDQVVHTLHYSANGGTSAPADQAGYPDAEGYTTFVVASTLPVSEGCTFLGWSTDPAGEVKYLAGDTLRVNQDITLYAVWQADGGKITYNSNGADSGTVPVDDTLYPSGATAIVAGNPGGLALKGYVFVGWNTEPTGKGITYAMGGSLVVTAPVTLYALWVKDEQLFIFNGQVWQQGMPQIYNGTTWQTGELSLFANDNWNS